LNSAAFVPAASPPRCRQARRQTARPPAGYSSIWDTIRWTSTRSARAPGCRRSRSRRNFCASSSRGAEPRCQAGCSSAWKSEETGKPRCALVRYKKKERDMYEILVYLFENCHQREVADDRERIARKLSAAGFEDADISEALHWLAGVLRAPYAAQ